MGLHTRYNGKIVFTSSEKADEAKAFLLSNKWLYVGEDGNLYWAKEVGNGFGNEEKASIIHLGTNILSFSYSSERNIHTVVDYISKTYKGFIDKNETSLRSFSMDGAFELYEWRDGIDVQLSADEVEQIIGYPISEIDYGVLLAKTGLANSADKAYQWLDAVSCSSRKCA